MSISKINIPELKAEMARIDLSIPKLANKIGLGKKTLYQKFSGKTQFTLPEIVSICNVLELDGNGILNIFFNQKVS